MNRGHWLANNVLFYINSTGMCISNVQLARHMQNPGEEHWNEMKIFLGCIGGKQKNELII